MTVATLEKPEQSTAPMGLIELEIKDFKRHHHLVIHARRRHVGLRGPNTCGKSSVIEAIYALTCGPNSRTTPEPIRQGADKASIVADLGPYKIKRTWTSNKKSTLEVRHADGSKYKGSQEDLIKGWLAQYPDPQSFTEGRKQDQLDMLLTVCGRKPPVDEVERITGERIMPLAGELSDSYLGRLSADDTGVFFVRRTEANRLCTQKRGALEEQQQIVEQLGGPLTGDASESQPSELLAEEETLAEQASAIESARSELATIKSNRDKVKHSLDMVIGEHKKKQKDCNELREEIERLKARLTADEEAAAALQVRIDNGKEVLAGWESDVQEAEAAIAKMPDPSPRRAEIRKALQTIEVSRSQNIKRRFACEQLELRVREMEQAISIHKKLDDMLEALRDLRAHQLDDIDIGIKGLEARNGELYLNGKPFSQGSTGERDEVGVLFVVRQNPELRLMKLDNSERFDEARLKNMLRIASRHDWGIMYAVREEARNVNGSADDGPFIELRDENGEVVSEN